MRSVLTAIINYLNQDQEFLDTLEGGSIWDMTQPPEDATYPTVTTLWQENTQVGSSRGLRLGLVTFDIWDLGGSSVRCEKIRNELEYLLDRKVLTVGERQWARFFIGTEAQIPTEVDENLVHWTLDFDVRYWRQALIKRWVSES